MGILRSVATSVCSIALLPSCYAGFPGGDLGPGLDDGPQGTGTGGDAGEESGDAPAGEDPPPACADDPLGPAAMVRLSTDEVARAIRDLLGVTIDVASLPGDERLGPFTINTVSVVNEPAAHAYQRTAEAAAADAMTGIWDQLPCTANSADDDCARSWLESFGRRAFRRPLQPDEAASLWQVFDAARSELDFAYGVEVVLSAILQSPNFLYRVELGDEDANVLRLTEYELATRMSFFLWGTIPDDPLLDAAAQGRLGDTAEREAYARAMLADPRAREGVGRLYSQLFGASGVRGIVRDPVAFPDFSDALAIDMEAEIAATTSTLVLEDDAPLGQLLTSTQSRASADLAAYYGVELDPDAAPDEAGLYRIELPAAERAGMLTRAGLMARLSHNEQTAPMLRADYVLKSMVCRETPPAPADADAEPPAVDPNATGRELLEMKTAAAECQTCHVVLNGIGFSFEHYDAAGKYRTHDGSNAVDAQGDLVVSDVAGTFDGAIELSRMLSESVDVANCVLLSHAEYALAREIDPEADACFVDTLRERFGASDVPLSELLVALVAQESFARRRVADITEQEDE